jgi:outer membrane immunogenic protein
MEADVRHWLSTISAAAILASGSAFAADLGSAPPPAPLPVPVFTWTGFYVGAHVGGAWDSDKWLFSPALTTTSNHASGVFGGGQVGYNYQISSFVLGLEGDASASHLASGNLCPNPSFTCSHNIDFLASLRARVGFTPFDRTLLYATGGVAFADVRHTALPPGVAPFFFTGSYSDTRVGWALGGGLEYALTNNWSVKIEYIHYGLGSSTAPMGTLSAANTTRVTNDVDTVDVGLNYRF